MQVVPYVPAEEVIKKSLASYTEQTKVQKKANGYTFSEAGIEDVEGIVAVINEAIRTTHPFRKAEADRTNVADVTKEVREPGNMRWYVMKSRGDAVGKDGATIKAGQVVGALLYTSENTTDGYVNIVGAHAAVRGTGVGAELVRKVLHQAAKAHKEQVSVWCVDDPKLVGFYKTLGFDKPGRSGIYDSAYLKPEFAGKIKICEKISSLTHLTVFK